ncbi:L-serine ammonia-lyase, iron-sulfur-dependent subunit beta [Marinicrinis lubricantis]|uniref:L-serine deaminase n=1 Tax=Marinicrinis lubricantis TaxID=2086470 RepID=A0ABW1IRG2_9BACL
MRFKDVFSIIGPSMVGPSSSHTAGAVRIGRTARHIFGEQPTQAEIVFYGSFADTYRGHGTDLAVTAGLLDMDTDDLRIRDALQEAKAAGIEIVFQTGRKPTLHPNTAKITLRTDLRQDVVIGSSIGGGNIVIQSVNDFDVGFSVVYPTLLVFHDDRPGIVANITSLFSSEGLNIGYMDVDRKGRSGDALTVVETDEAIPTSLMDRLRSLPYVHRISLADLTSREVRE